MSSFNLGFAPLAAERSPPLPAVVRRAIACDVTSLPNCPTGVLATGDIDALRAMYADVVL